jgi:hypothetical protein
MFAPRRVLIWGVFDKITTKLSGITAIIYERFKDRVKVLLLQLTNG